MDGQGAGRRPGSESRIEPEKKAEIPDPPGELGPPPRGSRKVLALLLGTALGVGLFPFAPGTAGTLVVGLPLAWALGSIAPWAVVAGAGLLFAAGLWTGGACERIFRRRDPSPVVLDEVVGMLITVVGLAPSWGGYLAGFVLFRIADILKPWPARRAERLPGGPGILLDDVVAGLYARAALEVGIRLFRALGWTASGG